MKHPYEAYGSIAAGACLVFIIGFAIGDYLEIDTGTILRGADAGSSIDQYIHSALPPKPVWDKFYSNMELDCKASKNLQEFHDCVNP